MAICWIKRVTAVSINSTAVRQAQQASTSYSSAVEIFCFSTTDYSPVELASAGKLTQFSLRPPIKGKGE